MTKKFKYASANKELFQTCESMTRYEYSNTCISH